MISKHHLEPLRTFYFILALARSIQLLSLFFSFAPVRSCKKLASMIFFLCFAVLCQASNVYVRCRFVRRKRIYIIIFIDIFHRNQYYDSVQNDMRDLWCYTFRWRVHFFPLHSSHSFPSRPMRLTPQLNTIFFLCNRKQSLWSNKYQSWVVRVTTY